MKAISTTLFVVICAVSSFALAAMPATLPSADDLPEIKQLPDPFVFPDGSRVHDAQDWQRRRQQIKDLFQDYEYGHLPPKPQSMTIMPGPVVVDDAAGVVRQSLLLTMKNGDNELVMHVRLTTPKGAVGRLPVVVRGGFGPFPRPAGTTRRSPATLPAFLRNLDNPALFMTRGYALAEFNFPEVALDNKINPKSAGVYVLYGKEIDCGTLMAWAWGFQRTIDALLTLDNIDPARILVTGHSRYGNAALLAGAFDERVALTVSSHSGCAGAAPFRFLFGKCEAIQNAVGYAPQWFSPNFQQFVGKVDHIPFDQHMLRALVAPRGLLSNEGLGDAWTNPQGSQLTYLAAKQVYDFLGAGDKISIRFRPGGHIPNDGDMLDFADHLFFGKPLPNEFGQLPYPEDSSAFAWTTAN